MTDCDKCGHELGIGRYCTNCGHPVDGPVDGPADDPAEATAVFPGWRTDTAERPSTPAAPTAPEEPPTPPPTPPPAWTPPPAPRFPLFADEVDEGTGDDPEVGAVPHTHRRRSRLSAGWAVAAVVLVVVLLLGVWLVLSGGGDDPTATQPPAGSTHATPHEQKPSAGGPSSGAPTGLMADSQVTVPATAGPGQDTAGHPVDYEGANMLDGVPETCWRMPGDGSGEDIVVTLPEQTRLRSVGMINGYAKKGGDVDWYHGNRRIEQVEWVFDDGTTVAQTLGDTQAVQSVDVDVTTRTVTLRLVKVSAPGTGSSRRDFTAISDLLFVAGG